MTYTLFQRQDNPKEIQGPNELNPYYSQNKLSRTQNNRDIIDVEDEVGWEPYPSPKKAQGGGPPDEEDDSETYSDDDKRGRDGRGYKQKFPDPRRDRLKKENPPK